MVTKPLEEYRPTWTASGLAHIDFHKIFISLGKPFFLAVDLDHVITKPLGWNITWAGIFNIREAGNRGWIAGAGIISNAGIWPLSRRVGIIADQCNLPCHACVWPYWLKPDEEAFLELFRHFHGFKRPDIERTVVIGDQLGTDILGANQIGAKSIYVDKRGDVPWYKRAKFRKELIIRQKLGLRFPEPSTPWYLHPDALSGT
ncbi:MAG: HAD hydrolase-like protein [Patescibacteria group bacterium]